MWMTLMSLKAPQIYLHVKNMHGTLNIVTSLPLVCLLSALLIEWQAIDQVVDCKTL